MTEIVEYVDHVTNIERFQSLQAGQYWRARLRMDEHDIDKDEVLLLESIKWAEDAEHTIVMRAHPTKIGKSYEAEVRRDKDGRRVTRMASHSNYLFLTPEFLEKFEYEPDHQRVRADEVRIVHSRISALQSELIEAQANPAILQAIVSEELAKEPAEEVDNGDDVSVDEEGGESVEIVSNLPVATEDVVAASSALATMAGGSVADAIKHGVTKEFIASMRQAASREHKIATIKSKWIGEKTGGIKSAIEALTPFFEEQAAAALAGTEDVRTYVAKLMKGIESLDLYVGKGVAVQALRKGESAPKDVPLSFMQAKLLMDEELSAWADLDESFDFTNADLFSAALEKHDDLVQQIFPTERCVVVMATTRRNLNYGHAITSAKMNKENHSVFMLVRDGMNIYRVHSPVESHLGASKLFPSQNDQNDIFKGFDGTAIRFDDVHYTDRLRVQEDATLHYKRFLLLACGLDHRENLFGDFYEGEKTFDFVSLAFQEKYCRFIHDHDGEGMLPNIERLPVEKWIDVKNAYLKSGSRVLCYWTDVMNDDTAPAACKRNHNRSIGFETIYRPQNKFDIVVAYREGKEVYVDVPVFGHTSIGYKERTFNCKVRLSKGDGRSSFQEFGLGVLCLDAVSPSDLRTYIYDRRSRVEHLHYIRTFKHALRRLEDDRTNEADTRLRLTQALANGNVATGDEAVKIIDQCVMMWRASNRGADLPKFVDGCAPAAWKSLLDQLYILAGAGRSRVGDVEAFCASLGYRPLRLVVSGKAQIIVYAEPKPEECDNRFEPHAWVHRIVIAYGKKKITEKRRKWAVLPRLAASETVTHEWDAENSGLWSGRSSSFKSFESKRDVLALLERGAEFMSAFTGRMSAEAFNAMHEELIEVRSDMMSVSVHVENPNIFIPFGVVKYPHTKEVVLIGAYHPYPEALLFLSAPTEGSAQLIRKQHLSVFRNYQFNAERFDARTIGNQRATWKLGTLDLSQGYDDDHSTFGITRFDPRVLHEWSDVDPLLSTWFDRWKVKRDGHSNVWVAERALASDGALNIDDLLGVARPEDYEPTTTLHITLKSQHAVANIPFPEWYDIVPGSEDFSVFFNGSRQGRMDELVNAGHAAAYKAHCNGRSSNSAGHHSRALARAYIEKSGQVVVKASDLPDAPKAPEGVERWYVVGKAVVGS